VRRSFFEQDEQERVDENGEEVADEQTRIDAREKPGGGEQDQVGHDKVGEWVADGDDDEEAPDAEPGCHDGKYEALNEERDESVDGHDEADFLGGEAETAGEVRETGGSMVVGGKNGEFSLVLEEDWHQMIVGHGVVGIEAKRYNKHYHRFGDCFAFIERA